MTKINIIKNNRWIGNYRPVYSMDKYINANIKNFKTIYQTYGSGDVRIANPAKQIVSGDPQKIEIDKYACMLTYCTNEFKVKFRKNYR